VISRPQYYSARVQFRISRQLKVCGRNGGTHCADSTATLPSSRLGTQIRRRVSDEFDLHPRHMPRPGWSHKSHLNNQNAQPKFLTAGSASTPRTQRCASDGLVWRALKTTGKNARRWMELSIGEFAIPHNDVRRSPERVSRTTHPSNKMAPLWQSAVGHERARLPLPPQLPPDGPTIGRIKRDRVRLRPHKTP